MKSPMVENAEYIAEEDKARYTDLQVLESPAGYYVGTLYSTPEGPQHPGSRDSSYYPTRKAADQALKDIITGKLLPRLSS